MTASQPCSACGHENRLGAKFCQNCAARLDLPTGDLPSPSSARPPGEKQVAGAVPLEIAYCPSCQKEVSPGARFCSHCGAVRQSAPQENRSVDQANAGAPPTANPNLYTPTLPPPSAQSPAGISKTLPLSKAASAMPITPQNAADYQLAPPQPTRLALPSWLWFLLGLLVGVLLTVAVVQYGAGLSEIFYFR